MPNEPTIGEIPLPNGIVLEATTKLSVDFESMRVLVESGVPIREVARRFKVNFGLVQRKAQEDGWVTPRAIGRMRRELANKQKEIFRRSGKSADVAALKAQIWEERGEEAKEKTFEIVMAALEGVSPEKAKKLIQNPLGLAHITTVMRQITGEEVREDNNAPRLAVNIGLLRTDRPVQVVEAEVVD